VDVTTLNDNPIVGKSFSMECNIIVAKGITGSVDIVWTAVDGIVKTANNTMPYMNSLYLLYRDIYNIPLLQLSDNNTEYYCNAVINEATLANDSYKLIIGK